VEAVVLDMVAPVRLALAVVELRGKVTPEEAGQTTMAMTTTSKQAAAVALVRRVETAPLAGLRVMVALVLTGNRSVLSMLAVAVDRHIKPLPLGLVVPAAAVMEVDHPVLERALQLLERLILAAAVAVRLTRQLVQTEAPAS
jgi:hypothetical protein